MEQWPTTNHPKPKPLAYVKMSGRPRKARRREVGEAKKGTKLFKVGIKMTCSRCRKTGQNTRTCSAKSTGNTLRRTMGKVKEVLDCTRPTKKARAGVSQSKTQEEASQIQSQTSLNSSPAKRKQTVAKPRQSPRLKAVAKRKRASTGK